MTERARDAEPRDVIVGVHGGLKADDRVHLEQRDRRRRALEIDLLENAGRQHVGVDLEPDFERRRRIDALLDDLVQAQRVGPELLVAERVEAEDLLALGQEGFVGRWRLCRSRRRWRGSVRFASARYHRPSGQGGDEEQCSAELGDRTCVNCRDGSFDVHVVSLLAEDTGRLIVGLCLTDKQV